MSIFVALIVTILNTGEYVTISQPFATEKTCQTTVQRIGRDLAQRNNADTVIGTCIRIPLQPEKPA